MNGRTIRGRVARIVAPPLVAMVVLLTFVAAGEAGEYRVASTTDQRVTVVLTLQRLVEELQRERGVAARILYGDAGMRDDLAQARRAVDSRRVETEELLEDGGALEEEAAAAVGELDGLAQLRGSTDAGAGGRDQILDAYSSAIAELSDIFLDLETVADDRLRRGAESLEQLNVVTEATAQERIVMREVLTTGRFTGDDFSRFVGILSVRDLALGEFDEFADSAAAAGKERALGTGPALAARAVEEQALRAGDGRPVEADAASWDAAVAAVLGDLALLRQRIGADVQSRAADLRQRAAVQVALLGAVVLASLAGSVYLATSGIRTLAGPLAELAREAHQLAQERLPQAVRRAADGAATGPPAGVPVAPGASVEVRQVADAFARVQETAYALATEQALLRRSSAESLANLGRRNQNLLRRQLGFITRLELEEPNPAGLANLFELDHLATRMRRNAESLLVLVGAASPRQLSAPAPMTDVIRAAVSEVEEYRRVTLRRLDEVPVQGAAATGLAHMLAELVENGLTFSPPDQEVEIHGRRVGDGYLVAISDEGVGMSDDELRRANERLRGEGDFLLAPGRYLGHHVVGRLAAELGVQVQLTPSAVTGVTARVRIPATVLAGQPAVSDEPGYAAPAVPSVVSVAEPVRERPRADEVDYVVVPAPRTPNGLRKRVPRAHRARVPEPSVTASPPVPSAVVADSPAAVGARLTALRDGIHRNGHP